MIEKKRTSVIIGATLLVILGLWFGAGGPSASEQLEDCISQSDLACIAELAYRYPSSTEPEIERKKAAISLAYLGKPEKAFGLYTDLKWRETWSASKLFGIINSLISSQSELPASFAELRSDRYRHRIVSAILVYLTIKNRTDEIDKYVGEIADANEKLAVLNHAWYTMSRPVSLMQPENAERMREVIAAQLNKLSQSKINSSELRAPDLLSISYRSQLLALANKIENPDKRKSFIDGILRYNQQASTETELFESIESSVWQGDTEQALKRIEANTKKGKPEFHNQRFASFIYSRGFYRFWQRADPVFQDLLAEILIEGSHSWEDPVCKTDVYTGLALFYAYSNRKDTALALLNRFKETEPNAYRNLGGESMCQTLGYFSTTMMQFILGGGSDVEREDYFTQFAEKSLKERIELDSEFGHQSFYLMVHAIGFTSSQSRDKILRLRKSIHATLLPEVSRDSTDITYLSWSTNSGDWENALALIADMFERFRELGSNDLLNKKISEQLFSNLINDEQIEEGFFWRENRARY